VVASRKEDACLQVAAELRAGGRRAVGHACHVGHWDEVERLVEAAYGEFSPVDGLVNNAGVSPLYSTLSEVTEGLFDKVIAVNLKGPFRLCALVGERMVAGDGGSIINVSSTGAVRPTGDIVPYSAAKAGVNALTVGFAHALGPKVRVNAIMPGPFLTTIAQAWDMEVLEERTRTFPLRRAGSADEIVGAALYLAGDASSFTTGSVLPSTAALNGACRAASRAPVGVAGRERQLRLGREVREPFARQISRSRPALLGYSTTQAGRRQRNSAETPASLPSRS
jgi:NAD(P)-dependent dehydrogenase (short-subunit alcohol dehydrogenase family)